MQLTTEEEINSDSAESIGLRLLSLASHVLLHKRLIVWATSCGVFAGIMFALILPVRYTATTRIMTPQQAPSSVILMMNQLSSSAVNPLAAAGGALSLRNPNDLYIGLLHSRPIADAIIHRFNLVAVYRVSDMSAARKELSENVTVISEKSGLIAISAIDGDRGRAAEIANSFSDQLGTLTKALALSESSQRRLYYEEQLKSAKEDLLNAQFAFQEIQRNKGLVQLDAQAKAMIAGLADLRARIAAKQVELQALRSFSTDQNPVVALAEKELDALQGEEKRLKSSRPSGSSDLGLQDVAGTGLEYLRAEHELQYRQTLLDLLLRQYDAARLDEAKYAAVIQIVEPATPPERRSSPHRVMIILLCTGLTFAGACLCVIIFESIGKKESLRTALMEIRLEMLSKSK